MSVAPSASPRAFEFLVGSASKSKSSSWVKLLVGKDLRGKFFIWLEDIAATLAEERGFPKPSIPRPSSRVVFKINDEAPGEKNGRRDKGKCHHQKYAQSHLPQTWIGSH